MLSWWGDFPRHQELLRSVRLRSYLQGYLEVPPLQSFTNYPRSHRFGSHYLKMKSERKTSTGPTPVRRNSKDGKFPASQADTGDSIGRVTWADMIGLSVPATSQRHPEGAVSVLRASTATAATNPSGTQTRTRRSERSAEKRLVEAERPPVYDALREGCIRLVQIGQDPLTGFIECRTEHFPLEAPPRYTALSYACGARPADFNIKLNGKEWYIRKNLSRFLRQHVQIYPDSQEWMWIDAICINQENLPERTHQVKLMANIYRNASRVLVWLGPAYENSDSAMSGIESSTELAQTLLALRSLCSRKYWHRLWCLQELKLAGVRNIMCGSKIVAWPLFKAWLTHWPHDHIHDVSNTAAGLMIHLVSIPESTPLSALLDMTVELKCEETRDKAYSLLGLASDAWRIEPDYTSNISVFLNKILGYYIGQSPKRSVRHLDELCEKVENMFGVRTGTIFGPSDSTNYLAWPSTAYQGLPTRTTTLLWAVRYEHYHVQNHVEMLQRPQCPASCVFPALDLASSIAGFPFELRTSLKRGVCVIFLTLAIIASIAAFCVGRVHDGLSGWHLCQDGFLLSRITKACLLLILVEIRVLLFTCVFRPTERGIKIFDGTWEQRESDRRILEDVKRMSEDEVRCRDWLTGFEEYSQACY
jgi:hypothetical protein